MKSSEKLWGMGSPRQVRRGGPGQQDPAGPQRVHGELAQVAVDATLDAAAGRRRDRGDDVDAARSDPGLEFADRHAVQVGYRGRVRRFGGGLFLRLVLLDALNGPDQGRRLAGLEGLDGPPLHVGGFVPNPVGVADGDMPAFHGGRQVRIVLDGRRPLRRPARDVHSVGRSCLGNCANWRSFPVRPHQPSFAGVGRPSGWFGGGSRRPPRGQVRQLRRSHCPLARLHVAAVEIQAHHGQRRVLGGAGRQGLPRDRQAGPFARQRPVPTIQQEVIEDDHGHPAAVLPDVGHQRLEVSAAHQREAIGGRMGS